MQNEHCTAPQFESVCAVFPVHQVPEWQTAVDHHHQGSLQNQKQKIGQKAGRGCLILLAPLRGLTLAFKTS